MATIAAEQPAEHRRGATVRGAAERVGMLVLVLAILWGLWEGYRWLWIREGWTWPFVVDSTTMPHIHDILRQLFRNPTSGASGDILLVQLLHAAWFTARIGLQPHLAWDFLQPLYLIGDKQDPRPVRQPGIVSAAAGSHPPGLA